LKVGANKIKMHGKYYTLKANVRDITSMSAHADQHETMGWLKMFSKKPIKIFLIHGEPQAQEIFRVKIQDELKTEVVIPQLNEEFNLFSA